MKPYAWIFFGSLAVACGGSAFTSGEDGGNGGSGNTDNGGSGDATNGGSSAGVLGRAGKGSGGSVIGTGGKTSGGGTSPTGGVVGVAGTLGVAGDLVSGGSMTAGGEPGTAGAPPDPIDKVCPASAPVVGAGCADGLVCSYGDDIRPSCRPMAKCSGGKWSIDKPVCEDLHGCGAIQVGHACSMDAKPCLLDTGIYCVCTGCTGAGGACSDQTVWACAGGTGGQACPVVPPNKGQTCANSMQVCPYGSCSTANKLSAVCDGTWSWAFAACPL